MKMELKELIKSHWIYRIFNYIYDRIKKTKNSMVK